MQGRFDDFVRIPTSEFATRPVARAVFGALEVLEELRNGGSVDLGWFDERSGRVGDPVNPSVFMVAVGVAGAVLHMSDQGVLPIHYVEGHKILAAKSFVRFFNHV